MCRLASSVFIIRLIKSVLEKRSHTLALAESCTGGLVSSLLTEEMGSSIFFQGGVIAYVNDVKKNLLKIPSSILDVYGAVSHEVVQKMALNVQNLLEADYGLAVSGIAGPGGGNSTKSVGTVYCGASVLSYSFSAKFLFRGSRRKIREDAAHFSLLYFYQMLQVNRGRRYE